MNHMFDKKVFSFYLLLIKRPDIASESLMTKHPFAGKSIVKEYVMPWCLCISMITFLSYCLFTKHFEIETAVIKSIFEFMVLFSSYFAAVSVCKFMNRSLLHKTVDDETVNVVIAYAFLVLYIMRIVMCIVPYMFYLKVLTLYVFYLLWVMGETVLQFDEKTRQRFMIANGLSIMVLPVIIKFILQRVVPNVAI